MGRLCADLQGDVLSQSRQDPELGACLWQSGPPKRSRFSAALNGYFPNLLAVDGCRDIVIAIGNKLPRPCEIEHRRKLEEISHGKHC